QVWREIDLHRIPRNDAEPLAEAIRKLLQGRNAALVALDRNHTICAERQQRAGEAARARPDLNDRDACERSGRARDAGREIEVEEKILPERAPGGQTVTTDHLAQRRQVVDAHGGLAAARRAASRSAATRLDGFARPLPAMSNAVPWSGDVRTNGKPSVTFTAWSNASVLIGTSAWS